MENKEFCVQVNTAQERNQVSKLIEQLGFKYEDEDDCYPYPFFFETDKDRTYADYRKPTDLRLYPLITISQLRDMVVLHRNNPDTDLISGADAKKAWANGEILQIKYADTVWFDLTHKMNLGTFDDEEVRFRLKPRTIKIGNVEINAPEIKSLKTGQEYFLPSFNIPFYDRFINEISVVSENHLKTNTVHLTKQNAIAHAKALILASGGEC